VHIFSAPRVKNRLMIFTNAILPARNPAVINARYPVP
jgi:hypothetical protein